MKINKLISWILLTFPVANLAVFGQADAGGTLPPEPLEPLVPPGSVVAAEFTDHRDRIQWSGRFGLRDEQNVFFTFEESIEPTEGPISKLSLSFSIAKKDVRAFRYLIVDYYKAWLAYQRRLSTNATVRLRKVGNAEFSFMAPSYLSCLGMVAETNFRVNPADGTKRILDRTERVNELILDRSEARVFLKLTQQEWQKIRQSLGITR